MNYHEQIQTQQQQTSLDAFYNLSKDKVRRDYKIILEAISKLLEANNTMLSRYTGLPINIITPRVYELRKLGQVTFAKKDFCPYTKNNTNFWKVV